MLFDRKWKKKIEEYNIERNNEVDKVVEDNKNFLDEMTNITKECNKTCEEIK